MVTVLTNVSDDLFVGEAKLFFSHSRRSRKSPFRLETGSGGGHQSIPPLSLQLRVTDPGSILLHDSRLDSARFERAIRATDIAAEVLVPAYEPENAGRWTNLRETSDGRHWSDGEYSWRRMLDASSVKRERAKRKEEEALARLTTQLPPFAREAVRDGRAVVIGRTASILDHVWGESKTHKETGDSKYDLRAYRVCKAFGNHFYALCRTETGNTDHCGKADSATAILIVGKFWPDESQRTTSEFPEGRERSPHRSRPVLTVVRKRGSNGTTGGRIIGVYLGDCLHKSLSELSPEEVAKTRRHYEGYIGEEEYASLVFSPKGNNG